MTDEGRLAAAVRAIRDEWHAAMIKNRGPLTPISTKAAALIVSQLDEALSAAAEPEPWEERVEYGQQTVEAGWIPEYRGIAYARQQRTVQVRMGEPVDIDHWSYADHRHPVEGCTFCADWASSRRRPGAEGQPVKQPDSTESRES